MQMQQQTWEEWELSIRATRLERQRLHEKNNRAMREILESLRLENQRDAEDRRQRQERREKLLRLMRHSFQAFVDFICWGKQWIHSKSIILSGKSAFLLLSGEDPIMESSDDEGEMLPDAVSDFYFDDKDGKPLSLSKLPVQWNETESLSVDMGSIFLCGNVDNGLGKFYQQVKAWKYDILTTVPEISVLSKDNHWIKLKKPRKSYENMIRSILISLHCLCFCKSKPEASGKSLWDHLSKVFSLYDIRPSDNDLIDHIDFLREAVKRDETLTKSKFLAAFLAAFLENPRNEDAGAATKPSFIVDDINGEEKDDDLITNLTEDNGGSLTRCERKCFRSFHATPDSEEAQVSHCESLPIFSNLEDLRYKCEKNCPCNIHQCFELGSSDESSIIEETQKMLMQQQENNRVMREILESLRRENQRDVEDQRQRQERREKLLQLMRHSFQASLDFICWGKQWIYSKSIIISEYGLNKTKTD